MQAPADAPLQYGPEAKEKCPLSGMFMMRVVVVMVMAVGLGLMNMFMAVRRSRLRRRMGVGMVLVLTVFMGMGQFLMLMLWLLHRFLPVWAPVCESSPFFPKRSDKNKKAVTGIKDLQVAAPLFLKRLVGLESDYTRIRPAISIPCSIPSTSSSIVLEWSHNSKKTGAP